MYSIPNGSHYHMVAKEYNHLSPSWGYNLQEAKLVVASGLLATFQYSNPCSGPHSCPGSGPVSCPCSRERMDVECDRKWVCGVVRRWVCLHGVWDMNLRMKIWKWKVEALWWWVWVGVERERYGWVNLDLWWRLWMDIGGYAGRRKWTEGDGYEWVQSCMRLWRLWWSHGCRRFIDALWFQLSMKLSTCFTLQIGVKAPRTQKMMTFLPAAREGTEACWSLSFSSE